MRLTCWQCGKPVSTDVPDDCVVRGTVECPECAAEQLRVCQQDDAARVVKFRESAEHALRAGFKAGWKVAFLELRGHFARALANGERHDIAQSELTVSALDIYRYASRRGDEPPDVPIVQIQPGESPEAAAARAVPLEPTAPPPGAKVH